MQNEFTSSMHAAAAVSAIRPLATPRLQTTAAGSAPTLAAAAACALTAAPALALRFRWG